MLRSGKHSKCDVWRGTAADLATAAAYIAARCAQLPLTLMHTAEVGEVSETGIRTAYNRPAQALL